MIGFKQNDGSLKIAGLAFKMEQGGADQTELIKVLSRETPDEYIVPPVQTLVQYALAYLANTKLLTFSEGTVIINPYACTNCLELNEVKLPQSLTEIGDRAFFRCSITALIIPSNVTSIGALAFGSNAIAKIIIQSPTLTLDGGTRANYGCFYANPVEVYDFRSATSVYELNRGGGLGYSDNGAKIVVPDNLYDTWKTTWEALEDWETDQFTWIKASEYTE